MRDPIYEFALFDGLPDDEFAWILANSTETELSPGEYFSREGDSATCMYVVLEGELQITRMINDERRVMGTTPRGIIGGELSLLWQTPAQVDAVAILPTRLMIFQVEQFRQIFAFAPMLGARILNIAMERTGGLATQMTQIEKMEALSKISANMAHSLNNPAAAASRSAKTLGEAIPKLQNLTLRLSALNLNDLQIRSLVALQQDAIRGAATWKPISPLVRADLEDELTIWLENAGVEDAFENAYHFVSAGISVRDLTEMVQTIPPKHVCEVLEWLACVLNTASLLHEIDTSTGRISELVEGVKQYTYMDRGKVQEVMVNRDLDNTLRMFSGRLRDVQVIRHYDSNLPVIQARGSDLNQVWTNIIENALDAMQDKGELILITRCENEFVMVEIRDNGPGIPDDVQPHIFEPFFSTKKFTAGTTGLGLDIVYRILRQHNATASVFSAPGETRFIVRLPMQQ